MQTREFHGHTVLQTIAGLDRPIPRDQLRKLVEAETGPNPQFRTCAAEGLDFDGLIAFLLERGKVREDADGLAFNRSAHICEDE